MGVVLHEAYLRSMASADEAPLDAEDVDFLRSVSDALAVEDGKTPSREHVAMTARAEGPLVSAVEAMERMAGELRRGAAAFGASRHGSEEDRTLVAALLRKAAWVDAVRAEATATLGAARGMQEDYLRRIAEDQEDVIEPDEARAIREASRDMAAGSTFVTSLEKAAAAAAIGEAAAGMMAEEMAELARRLRAGAEVFVGEDQTLVSRLLSKAESAEMHGVQAQAMARDLPLLSSALYYGVAF